MTSDWWGLGRDDVGKCPQDIEVRTRYMKRSKSDAEKLSSPIFEKFLTREFDEISDGRIKNQEAESDAEVGRHPIYGKTCKYHNKERYNMVCIVNY
jgi:hypothetical protein